MGRFFLDALFGPFAAIFEYWWGRGPRLDTRPDTAN